MKQRTKGATAMLAAALTLVIFGWLDSAKAQQTIQLSHVAAVLSDCQDLMHKIRQRYGRAPVCLEIKAGSQSITDLNGLVGLTDDMTNVWYQLQITTDVVDPTLYHYNASDINNVITMVQYSERGLTADQMNRVLTSNACRDTENRFKAMREEGGFTEQQYQSALSDLHKTVKGCAK
jgi:hypothetical protein